MPGRSYELTFALSLLAGTVGTLRSLVVLDGVRGALSPTLDEHFFTAAFEDPEQAEFYHGLHADRVKFWTEKTNRRNAARAQLGEALD